MPANPNDFAKKKRTIEAVIDELCASKNPYGKDVFEDTRWNGWQTRGMEIGPVKIKELVMQLRNDPEWRAAAQEKDNPAREAMKKALGELIDITAGNYQAMQTVGNLALPAMQPPPDADKDEKREHSQRMHLFEQLETTHRERFCNTAELCRQLNIILPREYSNLLAKTQFRE